MALRSIAAVLAALVFAPAAGAERTPPLPLALRGGLQPFRLAPTPARQRSCAAHRSHPATSVERKLRPVACEQPPLSRLDLALKHAAASLAAALAGP